MNCNN